MCKEEGACAQGYEERLRGGGVCTGVCGMERRGVCTGI